MSFSTQKRLQRIITTGITALALGLLSACIAPPATISARSPTSLTTLPLPSPLAPPAPSPEVIPSTCPFVEAPAATMPPSSATPQGELADAAIEPIFGIVAACPDYYESDASYYAKRFKGRRTFSGERYDPNGMTAATRNFPLQSWLKVINPANGKEVNVRINDRTGQRKTPLIDLSRAAAKKLGFLGKGKIHVHLIPILPTSESPLL